MKHLTRALTVDLRIERGDDVRRRALAQVFQIHLIIQRALLVPQLPVKLLCEGRMRTAVTITIGTSQHRPGS